MKVYNSGGLLPRATDFGSGYALMGYTIMEVDNHEGLLPQATDFGSWYALTRQHEETHA